MNLMGNLSILSGVLLLVAPRPMARVFALPESPWLCRALGLRDIAVGVLLRRPRSRQLGYLLRSGADAFDAVLIARNATSPGESRSLHVLGALTLSAVALANTVKHDASTCSPRGPRCHDF